MVGELHEFEMNLNDIISSGGYCMRLCLKKTKTKTRLGNIMVYLECTVTESSLAHLISIKKKARRKSKN